MNDCKICGKQLKQSDIYNGNHQLVNGVLHTVHEQCMEKQ